jgi:hypothetical protein
MFMSNLPDLVSDYTLPCPAAQLSRRGCLEGMTPFFSGKQFAIPVLAGENQGLGAKIGQLA